MKYSEAMLKGFKKVGGRQCRGDFEKLDRTGRVRSCCAIGAVRLGSGYMACIGGNFADAFRKAWRVDPADLNDEGMNWPDIYGMAVAAGL